MSEAKKYTQESCENEKTESTPNNFMNYREIRCENDCVKKKKLKANKQKTYLQLRKGVSHRSEQNG